MKFMKTLGERIRDLRKKAGYTQSEFIDILKKEYNLKADRVMLSKWECSKQCPHIETLKCIANALNVSLDYLNGIEEKPKARIKNISELHETQIPLYGKIACGAPIECNTDFDIETLSGNIVNGDFCVTARGDSMINAGIPDGAILIVHKQPHAENGNIVIAFLNGEQTVKYLKFSGDDMYLVPANNNYLPIPVRKTDEFLILGKVVEIRINL